MSQDERPAAAPVSVLDIVRGYKRRAEALIAALPSRPKRRDEATAKAYWQGCLDLANLLEPILEQQEARAKP